MGRFSGAIWDPAPDGVDGGSFVAGYPPRAVAHTTEGKTYAGARDTYAKKSTWPHFTASYEAGRFKVRQHIDTGRAARAL